VGLSHALRRIPTPRPLTHELITDVLSGFDIDVVAIRIVGRRGKTYFAELDLRGRTGRNVYSCRPTDALAIALHQAVPVPILIDSRLFEVEGDVAPWSPPPRPAEPRAPAVEAATPPEEAAAPPVEAAPEVQRPTSAAEGIAEEVATGPIPPAAARPSQTGKPGGPTSDITAKEAGNPAPMAVPAAEGVAGT
jgi:hypothetical protein